MSTFKVKYYIQYWQNHPELDDEFVPEDVMPYYDIFNNGDIILYIKQRVKNQKWLIFSYTEEIIKKVNEKRIKVVVTEKPERRQCGD